ncbi:OmpA family protein [Sphingobacterium griseoflavum]|uniref:Cell envelope biogenesis protein OmpA n=1 Tax=Sphingobacterium griseoflavum TaxID=1474952 RepID=A0ABQ3HZE4_9SPHI|nr:OmpA family protein [Sphingobacterium griseoflavum]GHE49086.1 cell envelope biogenesis protein OmpA [Sphingobacterium griseoflavum]
MMKIVIRYITLFLSISVIHTCALMAQEQPSVRQRADGYFLRMEYAKAAPLYEKLVDTKKPRVVDVERIGMSYLYLNAYDLAENWLARAASMEGHSKETELSYAEALKHNGKYAEAKSVLKGHAESYGISDVLTREIAGCDSAVVWMASPLPYDLRNEREINTDLSEFGAVPTSNGAIYTAEPKITSVAKSGMTGQPYLKVFSASRDNASLTLPNIMPYSYNDAAYHVGPVAVNKNEDMLFVTRTYPGDAVQRIKQDGKRFLKHNLELKIYKNRGNSWEEEEFPYNDTEAYSLGHAALSDDEQVLYFASNMPGGYGGTDIWYVELQNDGAWGTPQNAGSLINSAGDELFPAIYGSKMYYASDGFPGMGGLDVYVVEGEKSNFRNRRNLRYPLNSAADDFAYVVMADDDDAFYGYLSSNRKDGMGGDDIYSFYFEKPKINLTLKGFVYDKATNLTLSDTRVSLIGEDGSVVSRTSSNADGSFNFELGVGKAYTLTGEKNGYMGDPTVIAATRPNADTIIRADVYLSAMKQRGDKFVLENLYYDFDKSHIRPDAALILDKLVSAMRDNPTMKVELSSHTDSRGSDKYNMLLSDKRAKSAVDYVVSRGIERSRIMAKGYGESRLINKCSNGVKCTPAEHQANRRTEVEVLEY